MMNPGEPKDMGDHLVKHGDGVKDVGFLVEDVEGIFEVCQNSMHDISSKMCFVENVVTSKIFTAEF